MFHEYRDLISELKQSNTHFARLFHEHNELDEEIDRLEKDPAAPNHHDEIEQKKRKKLKLKDEIYAILKQESQQ